MFGLEHLVAALLSPRVRAKQLRQPTACFLWALTMNHLRFESLDGKFLRQNSGRPVNC